MHEAYARVVITNTNGFWSEAFVYGDESNLSAWRSAMNLTMASNGMELTTMENGPEGPAIRIYTYEGERGTILADRITVITIMYLD